MLLILVESTLVEYPGAILSIRGPAVIVANPLAARDLLSTGVIYSSRFASYTFTGVPVVPEEHYPAKSPFQRVTFNDVNNRDHAPAERVISRNLPFFFLLFMQAITRDVSRLLSLSRKRLNLSPN